jgi:hypothetical protein
MAAKCTSKENIKTFWHAIEFNIKKDLINLTKEEINIIIRFSFGKKFFFF